MDLHRMKFAKQKLFEWFNKKYQGRFIHFQVKDHDPTEDVSVEMDEGAINFQEILIQNLRSKVLYRGIRKL